VSRAAAAIALAALLAGCGITSVSSSGIGHPVGPSLEELGLRQRCSGEDTTCNDRALEIIRELMRRLGPRAESPEAHPPRDGQPDGLLLVTASSDPPFDFRAVDSAEGTTAEVVVDLTPSLTGGGNAYVVMEPGAFEIGPEGAGALLDALFVPID
jgi:hypothetical protein